MSKEEKEKADAEKANAMPVDPWDDPKVKKVKVHFLVDYRVGERQFKCNEFMMVPESVAKSICDNSSAEYAAK